MQSMNIKLRLFSKLAVAALLYASALTAIEESPVIIAEKSVELLIPECPLALGAVEIAKIGPLHNFTDWTKQEHFETYTLMRKVAQIWDERQVFNFLMLGMQDYSPAAKSFSWQMVPFPDSESKFLRQITVIWHTFFGSSCLSLEDRHHEAIHYRHYVYESEQEWQPIDRKVCANNTEDPFLKPAVLAKQQIYEGKLVRVLYNYAPLQPLAFLIITKEQRRSFQELTPEEYEEAQQVTQKIIAHYYKQGHELAYLFHKTGSNAGQTVCHWHQHLIFPEERITSYWQGIYMLGKLMGSETPLSDEELANRVEPLKSEFQAIFSR